MRVHWLRALSFCAAVTMTTVLFSSVSQAEIVWNLNDPNAVAVRISDVNTAGGLLVGDKLFSDFTVISSGNAPYLPAATDITLAGFQSDGNYGVMFGGAWFVRAGQTLDTAIGFSVSVSPQPSSYLIEDSTLGLQAANVSAPDAFVQIIENVYSAPPPQPKSIAQLVVDETSDPGNEQLLDSANFKDPNLLPVAYSKVWVVKDVNLFGGVGTPGVLPVASMSQFSESFSQTPEPQSLVLLLCGAPCLALYLWRRFRARR